MAITSAEDRLVGAGGALAGLLIASHMFSSSLIGVIGLALGMLTTVAPGSARRFDIAAMVGVWGLVALMFGPDGAGCFILAYAIVSAAAALAPTGLAGLVLATAVAAIAATSLAPAFNLILGAGWRVTSDLICILALGAPGLILGRIGAHDVDAWTFEAARVQLVGPQFLLVVLGGAVGGLHGVAAGVACGWLAAPVVALLLAHDHEARRVSQGVGVLAAGFLCAVAIGVAQTIAADAFTPIAIGLVAAVISLRVHAPDATLATILAAQGWFGQFRVAGARREIVRP